MRGSIHTSRCLSLYLIIITILLWFPCSYAARELTQLQKEARAYRDEGWNAQRQGDIETALSCYQKAVLLDPKYAVAYNDIGVILESRGDIAEAREMYITAIELAPEYPNSYSNLALLYEEVQDYGQAIACWVKRATLGGPNDPWAEVARRRLEEIARIYPEAYKNVGQSKSSK